MKFVGDESVESQIIERLRFDGHEVWYVAEMNPGISDDEVLQTANTFGCILLTSNQDQLVGAFSVITPGGLRHQ